MAERASVFQVAQWGVETTPGTAVAANKKLTGINVTAGVKADVKTFRAMGNKFNSLAALGKEWMEAKLDGFATYTEIVYPLCSVLAYAAPAQQAATIAYKWTLGPATSAADTKKTYTLEQGSAERAHKFAYGLVNQFGMQYSRDAVNFSGSMLGQAVSDGITLTSSPTVIALQPILPTQVTVKVADSQAGLTGASALTRVLSCGWDIADRFAPLWVLNAANASFVADVEKPPKLTAKLKQEADAEGMGLLTQLRSGATKFLRILAEGDIIASTYKWTLQVDLAAKVTNVSEFADQDGVFAVEWEMEAAHDSTWGKAFEVQVINTLTSL